MPEPQQEPIENRGIPLPVLDLPLESINIRAQVRGLWTDVYVEQKFGNKSDKPSLEAVYVFPLVEEAMVLGVEMQIGEKRIVSELRKREEAQRKYEQARDAGHYASLLEQERPNIFTMSVAGIEPNEEIYVITHYLAPVPWQADGGRLRFPVVVAPRFIPGQAKETSTGSGWAPDTDQVPDASRITPKVVQDVNYRVNIDIDLKPGFACYAASPSHGQTILEPVDLLFDQGCQITAKDLAPDRDIVITYRTKETRPQVLVNQGKFVGNKETEDFVIIQLTAQAGARSKDPISVVLCLDDSGSMSGLKCEGLKVIAKRFIQRLKDQARPVQIGIFAFGNLNCQKVLVPLSPIEEKHLTALAVLQAQSGGTYLGQALSQCMEMFTDQNGERCVIVISDGETEDSQCQKKPGIRIHTVGLDTAVNDATLKRLAQETGGQSEWVLPGEDYTAVANRLIALASGPVIRNISFDGLPKDAEIVGLSDLFSLRPATFAIRSKTGLSRNFRILGRGIDGSSHEWLVIPESREVLAIASQLWAKMKLRETQDADQQTELSLRYDIVCSTTALVAVMEKAAPTGKPERIDIPVILPHTWSYEAIFYYRRMPSVASAGVSLCSLGGGGTRRSAGIRFLSGPPLESMSYSLGGPSSGMGFLEHAASPELAETDETPVQPTPEPPPAQPAPKLLTEAESFLVQAEQGKRFDQDDNSGWRVFRACVETGQILSSWSELDRARLYFILVKLQSYGYKIEIQDVLKTMPTDADAYALWLLAEKELKKQ